MFFKISLIAPLTGQARMYGSKKNSAWGWASESKNWVRYEHIKMSNMYLATDLNWEHLTGLLEGNHLSIWSYISEINWDTCPNSFRRQRSFDSGYVFHGKTIFPKKSPKINLYPNLTCTLSSILSQVDRKGFERTLKKRRELNPPSFYCSLIH